MSLELKLPVNILSNHYTDNAHAYHTYLRENEPVHKGKLSVMNIYFVSRYEDCVALLKDRRFVRNRSTATGSRFPIPMPKSVRMLATSMLTEDDPEHRRLRGLVHQAFLPRRLSHLEGQIETLTHELLDLAEKKGEIDLIKEYALPIPTTVIAHMMGVSPDEIPELTHYIEALTSGLSGFRIAKSMVSDIPKAAKYCRGLVARKRKDPQDDILSGLIRAEEDGDKLSEDELVSMLFLLIVAGYETTVHLITNSVQTLLSHPQQLQRLRETPDLMESAVEECNRFKGPVLGTKLNYATEDVTLHNVVVPKGKPVIPLLGAANFDPEVFENPERFDIARSPNKHLGFGQGIHYCLGAPLARIETQIALKNLFQRNPNLQLAVPESQLKTQKLPLWNRYESLPVRMG